VWLFRNLARALPCLVHYLTDFFVGNIDGYTYQFMRFDAIFDAKFEFSGFKPRGRGPRNDEGKKHNYSEIRRNGCNHLDNNVDESKNVDVNFFSFIY